MPNMTCAEIQKLAERFEPVVRYDGLERWFPILAETWLRHCSPEDWGAVGAKKRGTAIMTAKKLARTLSSEDAVGGCASGSNTHIQLDENDADPNSIGNSTYETYGDDDDLFLDFAGWNNTNAYSEGSLDYLSDFFSNLGAAMNPSIVTEVPTDSLTPPPDLGGVPQPLSPTVYAEVDWAGIYPTSSMREQNSDFDPSSASKLSPYLAITYHYFYPATELPPDLTKPETSVLLREAQWEAVTLYLKGDPGKPGQSGRPTSFSVSDPAYVVYSQGYQRSDDIPLDRAECRPWQIDQRLSAKYTVEKDGEHPVAYVTAGTHKHLFSPQVGTSHTTSAPNPWLYGAGGLLVAAGGVVAILCETVVGCIVAAALIVIGLILILLSFLFKSEETSTQDPLPQGPEQDFSRGNGPAATPSGGSPGGQPSGSSQASPFTLRVIDRFQLSPPSHAYPPPAGCEYPSWWGFSGRWGVKIVSYPSNRWDDGSRRLDKFERSRAYWNTYKLVEFWNSNPDGFGP